MLHTATEKKSGSPAKLTESAGVAATAIEASTKAVRMDLTEVENMLTMWAESTSILVDLYSGQCWEVVELEP